MRSWSDVVRETSLTRERVARDAELPMLTTRIPTDSYVPQFDGLRAVAVVGVLFTHYLPDSLPFIGVPGFIGVRLFFVLSGFLITRILLAAQSAPPMVAARAFYARRFLRIFPLYYAACALMCLSSKSIREYAIWLFTYSQNIKFALDGRYPVVAHLWSLAVEEQFYLIWPWIVLLARPATLKRMLVCCVGTAIVSRAVIFGFTHNEVSTHVLPFACLDTLGSGALLALAHSRASYPTLNRWQRLSAYAALGIVTLALLSARTSWLFHVLADAILALVFVDLIGGLAVVHQSHVVRPGLLDSSLLQHLGKISYGIYVIHFFVPNQIVRILARMGMPPDTKTPLVVALSVVVTLGLSELSWRFFESPFNQLKRFFPYGGSLPRVS